MLTARQWGLGLVVLCGIMVISSAAPTKPSLATGQATAAVEARKHPKAPAAVKKAKMMPLQSKRKGGGPKRGASQSRVDALVKRELELVKKDKQQKKHMKGAIAKAAANARVVVVMKNALAKHKRGITRMLAREKQHSRATSEADKRQARKEVMHIYAAEADKLLAHGGGDGSHPSPYKDSSSITPWLKAEPRLNLRKPRRTMTFLDKAVDDAQTRAQTAPHAKAKVLIAIANRIQKVSKSVIGEKLNRLEATGELLQRAKARSAQRLIVYKAYNDGFGKRGNKYRHNYLCQRAVGQALSSMLIKTPPGVKGYLCKWKLHNAESGIRVAGAIRAALSVASKSNGQACHTMKAAADQMQVAEYEVAAVKSACPNMGIRTTGYRNRKVRRSIRNKIAAEMNRRLKGASAAQTQGHAQAGVENEVAKVIDAAKQAWRDVNAFGRGSPIPKGIITKPEHKF